MCRLLVTAPHGLYFVYKSPRWLYTTLDVLFLPPCVKTSHCDVISEYLLSRGSGICSLIIYHTGLLNWTAEYRRLVAHSLSPLCYNPAAVRLLVLCKVWICCRLCIVLLDNHNRWIDWIIKSVQGDSLPSENEAYGITSLVWLWEI